MLKLVYIYSNWKAVAAAARGDELKMFACYIMNDADGMLPAYLHKAGGRCARQRRCVFAVAAVS